MFMSLRSTDPAAFIVRSPPGGLLEKVKRVKPTTVALSPRIDIYNLQVGGVSSCTKVHSQHTFNRLRASIPRLVL